MNTISEFISAFHSFENCHNLFLSLDHHHRPWWDLVRYRVQFQLITDYALHPSRIQSKKTIFSLIRSLLSSFVQLYRLIQDIFLLLFSDLTSIQTLFVANRTIDYIDDQINIVIGDSRSLHINRSGNVAGSDFAIKYQSFQFFIRLFSRFISLPLSIQHEAAALSAELAAEFTCKGDILSIILNKLREEEAARYIWRFILMRANVLTKIIYVNDDSLKSLVFEARAKGIETEEVQHAYMGKEHIAFSYPNLKLDILTLPDKVVICRDTHDIVYPVKQIILKNYSKSFSPVNRDIDILIGSSLLFINEVVAMLQVLDCYGYRLAVKLHPSEPSKNIDIYRNSSNNKDLLIYSGNEIFSDIACRSKLFIPANPSSTASFEASEMGSKVLLFHSEGFKKVTVADSVASGHIFTLDLLSSAVAFHLSLDSDKSYSSVRDLN